MHQGKLLGACAIAQICSFLLCAVGTTSSVLAQRGLNVPATQTVLLYALLASVCGAVHLWSSGGRAAARPRRSAPWWSFLLLAAMDVAANTLVITAYQFTSITSVALLDCFTVPACMVLTWLAFGAKFQPAHIAGAALCMLGLAVLVQSDASSAAGDASAGKRPLVGDALVLLGAVLYAASNVAQEKLLSQATPWEVLGKLGAWGTLLSGAQALALERGRWGAAAWDSAAVGALLGFAASLGCFYVLVPAVLLWGGSTVLNLSLLTSDLWAAGARALLFGGFQGRGTAALFALALACEAAGIALYAWAGGTHAPAGGGDTSTPPLGAPYEQIEVVPLVSGGGGNSSDSDVHRPHGQARVAQATTKAGAGDGEDEEQAWLLPAGSLSTR